MNKILVENIKTHVVDILGNVKGRDQPVMLMSKATEFVANLGNETLISEDYVYFDPFCKAGEILLATAFIRSLLKTESKADLNISDIQRDMFLEKRFFALAPDERHFRLSLRTFLGNEKSHDENYTKIVRNGNYLSEQDGRLDETKFKEEIRSMIDYINSQSKNKKIIAIGNPPYQESDGGFGKSAKSIYNLFVDTLFDSAEIEKFLLVIPARWFGGGKGLDEFRERIRTSKHVKTLRYFKNASSVFPTVDINGGICFLHVDKTHNGITNFCDDSFEEVLDLSEFDIIPDDPKSFKIIRKLKSRWKGRYVGEVAWSSKPFGLRTDYFEKNQEDEKSNKNTIQCLSRNKIKKYITRSKITKNSEYIDLWKVCVSAVGGGSKGKRRSTIPLNQIFLLEPSIVTTETYNVIDVFDSPKRAENLVAYLKTDFARYLLGLRKITQHIPRDRWDWVPYMEPSKVWTDKDLFEYFGITKEEQEHIKKKVQEWS